MNKKIHCSSTSREFLRNCDIYISNSTGSLLNIRNYDSRPENIIIKNKLSCAKITALSWGTKKSEVLIGNEDGEIYTYSINTDIFTQNIGRMKAKIESIIPLEENLYIVTNKGLEQVNGSKKSELYIVQNDASIVKAADLNPHNSRHIAFGGINSDLRLLDINSKTLIWTAKGDPHDSLNLKQPNSISAVKYMEYPGGESSISIVTMEGCIKLYDTRAQRRPIKNMKHPDKPAYMSLTAIGQSHRIIVGTNKGSLHLYDLRNHVKLLKSDKSYMGAIVGIMGVKNYPEVLTFGLDRFMKLHNSLTLTTTYSEYLQTQPTCAIIRPNESFSCSSDSYEETEPKRLKLESD